MKKKINIGCFLIIIFTCFVAIIIKKDNLVNRAERRYLATKDSLGDYFDGSFSSRLETYLCDQFPGRDELRHVKAIANFNLFGKIENQNVAVQDGYAIKLQDDYRYDSIDKTMDKINALISQKFRRNRCYFAIIPDKSVFYTEYPEKGCDYNKVEEIVKSRLTGNTTYIEIRDTLELSNYYRTDSHWSQDKIIKTRDRLLDRMKNSTVDKEYTENTVEDFVGVYKAQAAIDIKNDTIKYLTNSNIEAAVVTNYETGKKGSVYNLDKLHDEKSMDKYDIFLSGAAPLLKIDNPSAKNNRTLFIFRDSFSSSLAPLLIGSYKTIYMVDLRYVDSRLLENYVKITPNDDVLFIYSTLLINSPNNYNISVGASH